jgi:hypothetical protein
VQSSERMCHCLVDGSSLFRSGDSRQSNIIVDGSFDVLHDVERGADDARVRAVGEEAGARDWGGLEGRENLVLPINGMS